METLLLFKYFNCRTTAEENRKIQDWLADDPDGSHKEEYRTARMIWNGMTLHAPQTIGFSAAHSTPESRSRWKKVIWACANVAVVALFAVGALFYARDNAIENLSDKILCASVPEGQTYELILEDGTSMFMNSGTEVEYPAVFSKKNRTVSIKRGEVLFDVARDEKRPFIVETFASDIKVLGTQFNIEVDAENEYCSTTLLRGSIQLDSHYQDESIILSPDMKATFHHGKMVVGQIDDAAEILDWTKGLINLKNMDFRNLMRKYEKAFNINIVIDTEDIPEIAYKRGKIRISDGIEHALGMLQMASDFTYTRDYETNTIHIR